MKTEGTGVSSEHRFTHLRHLGSKRIGMQMLLGREIDNPLYNNSIYIPAELKLHS